MIFAAQYGTDFLSYVIFIVFTLIAVCVSLVAHEVAHGLVAVWNGDMTAKYSGRLSPNPLKHFDLIGFMMLMLIGFGYAKPVPVNPYNFRHYRRGLFTVAIAGVVMNIIIAFFSSLLYVLLLWGYTSATSAGAANAFYYFMILFKIFVRINLALFFFNLLPIYPLDGFRVVESFTHKGNKFCAFMRENGQYILWGLVGLSFIISMASSYVSLPYWFSYIDVLGTYIGFCSGGVEWAFNSLFLLMLPVGV